jgi:type I restriction enzyme S subunit
MSEWQEIKLGEVSEITSSKRIFYSDYVNEGIPFWRSKEVIEKFNRKTISTDLFITPEKYSEIKNRFGVPQPNDILLTSVGTLGIPYLVEDNEHFYFKDGNLTWIRNIDEQRLSPQYLYKWLASEQGRNSLREITIGSTQEALTIVGLKSLNLLLPPLPEQQAIATVLSSLDDKIDLLHRQNKTLEAMAASLFRQWFVEETQEDWNEYSLSDFVTHLKGNVVPAKTPDKIFQHYSLPAFDAGMKPTVEAGSEILSNKYAVKPWTILVSKLNPRFPRIWPIGDLTEGDAICSTEFQVFTPKSENLFGYIYFFLRSGDAKDELTMAASGTSGSHQRVRPEDILNIKTNLPSMDFAVQYSALVMPNNRKMWANNAQIQSLEKLRDTLLPKLMSGEVRVEV